MDNSSTGVENGGGGSPSGGGCGTNGVGVRARSPLLHSQSQAHFTTLIVRKDERGFGMKVSGDNPVFVQSVKDGGAAERAGLHSGDTIIKVNGINVFHSKHTEVVEMIKASNQVVLTVQQSPLRERSSSLVHSPSLHRRTPSATHLMTSTNLNSNTNSQNRDRITAPLPVDDETQRIVDHNKVYHLRLMLEDEERNIERLRSQLAKCDQPDTELLKELARSERTVLTLNNRISALLPNNQGGDVPPPLPSRNITTRTPSLSTPAPGSPTRVPLSPGSPPRQRTTSPAPGTPPPLPPRQYLLLQNDNESRLQHQLSSPSPPVTPSVLPHNHQRTKSSPENLSSSKMAEVSPKRIISSESMSELNFAKKARGGLAWEFDVLSPRVTPPGTPPPPYPVNNHQTSASDLTDNSPLKGTPLNHSLTTNIAQHSIISMEDEDMSDQELSQLENHGPFKSLKKLWNHQAHLAVFLKYVISNSDPSSLLFYLVTDLFKEGNIKEMKKWAYEIHSSFLVPGAPLRLNNVDENVAREIDEVLLNESDKEEILRRVFWKARLKAKEELNTQLEDFQSKRTSGLNTLFGPTDSVLNECIHDKSKEVKVIENILLPVLEPYLEDIEKDVVDDRRFSTGAALGTVMAKVFGVRGTAFSTLIDRVPTYVSKDKSLKAKFMGRSKKQVTIRGHHCVAHQYYTVTYCNHCQNIIWGIGPQGYQCTNCNLNIHRTCVKILEENCPGPMVKKEKGNDRISKFMERIRSENTRRKPSNLNLAQVEKTKRLLEEEAAAANLVDNESEKMSTNGKTGERSTVGGGGGGGGRGEKRPDTLREESSKTTRESLPLDNNSSPDRVPPTHDLPTTTSTHSHGITKNKSNPAAINRSESYKERIHQKRQLRERRKTSDPNLSKTNNDVELDNNQALSYVENSGSSSNSSLSTRSLESPSNSVEVVSSSGGGQAGPVLDSDIEAEPDPPDWTKAVPEPQFKLLTRHEKKRQEVINELFHTERTHVRGLKVLDQVFHRPMREEQILPPDSLQLLFANLEEILEIHSTFNSLMKNKRKEGPVIGDISSVLQCMFEGGDSENFQRAAADFCARQHIALEHLKGWRKKDPKLHSFLADCEANPACRRLLLKDIISTGWQRLTKYPLLLENLARHTREESEDYGAVQRAIERSREILNHVERAVKEAEDQHRLAELQRRIDRAPFDKSDHPIAVEFRNLDLKKHRLIHEGGLNWRIAGRPKLIDLHVVLLEDIIILLQKQDEKYVLKFYSSSLSPIIKVSTVLVRPNAVEQNGLYLVNTSQNGAQIYELLASSMAEKQKWFKHISEAAEAYKQKPKRGGEPRNNDSSHQDAHDQTNSTSQPKTKTEENNDTGDTEEDRTGDIDVPLSTDQPTTPEPNKPNLDGGRRVEESQLKISIEPPLIDPCEVLVTNNDRVHLAEAVLTPLGKLKRKDETIRQALAEKQALVADMLNVPREDFETIADMAGEPALDKDPAELLLASVNQVNQLTRIMNEALDIGEQEVVGGGVTNPVPASRLPSVPAHKLQPITTSLIAYLTQLLIIMPEKEEERERLRRELQVCREQLHALHEKQDFTKPSCEVVICAEDDPVPLPLPPQSPVSSPDQAHSPEVFVDAMSGDSEGTACEQPLSE